MSGCILNRVLQCMERMFPLDVSQPWWIPVAAVGATCWLSPGDTGDTADTVRPECGNCAVKRCELSLACVFFSFCCWLLLLLQCT